MYSKTRLIKHLYKQPFVVETMAVGICCKASTQQPIGLLEANTITLVNNSNKNIQLSVAKERIDIRPAYLFDIKNKATYCKFTDRYDYTGK